MYFLGSYLTKFNGKSRIILPKKFRVGILGKEIILTQGLDGCIWGFNSKEWVKQSKIHLEIPITEEKGRFLRRNIFAHAYRAELDHQGRFIISSSLIDFAQINKEVLIVGAGDHFELWNPKVFNKLMRQKI